jgi:predicted O-methyltransferase YrrM
MHLKSYIVKFFGRNNEDLETRPQLVWDNKYSDLGEELRKAFLENPGYAARPLFLKILKELLLESNAVNVLEIGTGVSTQLMASFSEKRLNIYTVDQDAKWQKKVCQKINKQNLEKLDCINYSLEKWATSEFCHNVKASLPKKIDAVIIDAPAGADRLPDQMIDFYVDIAKEAEFLIIDDTDRPNISLGVNKLLKRLGGVLLEYKDDISIDHKFVVLKRDKLDN